MGAALNCETFIHIHFPNVYSPLTLSLKYLQYYLHASNGRGHGMHSPFVYDLIRTVLNDRTRYPDYARAEAYRAACKKDNSSLEIKDMGAGSVHGTTRNRSVASIARHAAKPPKYGQLLYRLARKYQPASILELGTSLGISSRYLAYGAPSAQLHTLEGVPAVAEYARRSFVKEGLPIQLTEGNFDDTLGPVLEKMGTVELCFVDGNHRQEPTLRYFRQLLPHLHNGSMIIFDDIHWSAEMEAAWQDICAQDAVRCSIDLFFVGIVLFRSEFREKQHFSIRF